MNRIVIAAAAIATLTGIAAPALAQDYRQYQGSYDSRYDDRGYDARGYESRDDRRDYDGRGDWQDRRRLEYRPVGDGWRLLRETFGPRTVYDRQFIRWVVRSFDYDRNGVIDYYEGRRARAAYAWSLRSGNLAYDNRY